MSFKIQLSNDKFYANKSGRIQHYKSIEQAKSKCEKEKLTDYKIVEAIHEKKAKKSNNNKSKAAKTKK